MIQGAISASQRKPATKVWVRHLPKGASASSRSPRKERPRSGVMFVFFRVSSMNTSRCGRACMNGWRRAIQSLRARATSARRRSSATSDFFYTSSRDGAGRATSEVSSTWTPSASASAPWSSRMVDVRVLFDEFEEKATVCRPGLPDPGGRPHLAGASGSPRGPCAQAARRSPRRSSDAGRLHGRRGRSRQPVETGAEGRAKGGRASA